MILLASLIFALLFYVIPLELLLVMLAEMLGDWRFAERLWLIALNFIAYVLILTGVGLTKGAYEFFEGHREAHYRRLKGFLDLRGSRWMNLYGLLLVGGGTLFFFYQGLLPFPFIFLFVATIFALGDVFYRDALFVWKRPLPEPLDFEELEEVKEDESIAVEFKWTFMPLPTVAEKRRYKETFHFLRDDYEAARQIARHNDDFPRYVTDGLTIDVRRLAHWFRAKSREQELSPLAEAENVVTFVRSIRYATDEATHGVADYANYPIETLVEATKGSDCEDHAILAAALLHHLGHQVALFFIDLKDSAHLALGYGGVDAAGFHASAKSGEAYAYYETIPTSNNDRFGDICREWLEELKRAEVWEIE
ncbi:MAG: hypothetical protein ACFE0O_04530 [Opitutales bacterium]